MYESGEMYLETILILSKSDKRIRAIDIANEMGFSKPSVSRALGILKKEEYIEVDTNGNIFLTESGEKIAKTIYERHNLLTEVLIRLGVDEKIAQEDACKIEHVISDTSIKAIKIYIKTKKADNLR